MPRYDLTTGARNFAIHKLKEMQRKDHPVIRENIELAKAEDSVRDLSFGRLALSIPDDHRTVLGNIFPDLDSHDAQIRTKAWKAFLKHDLSRPYRINAKETGNVKKRSLYLDT